MIVKLHKQARTTPAIRAEIRHASGTLAELAARYNVTIDTIRKWKSRDSVEDRLTQPRTPHTTHQRHGERFNGRISDVLTTHRFDSAQNLAQTLSRYVRFTTSIYPTGFAASDAASGHEGMAETAPSIIQNNLFIIARDWTTTHLLRAGPAR